MTYHPHPAAVISLEQATALVEAASGADTGAINALEAVITDLRRSRAARLELATRVPTHVLRQVLLARSASRELIP
jgi:hypothetical protein